MSITRRQFVVGSTVALVGLTGRSSEPWYATMRRCGQLNLNERDPLTLDVASWIDYWASLKLDALLLNGGGIVAFYPTDVPYHHRSEFLGSRDLFGELVAAPALRIAVALQILHVQSVLYRSDGGDLPRDRCSISGGWILHQRLAEHWRSDRVPLRELSTRVSGNRRRDSARSRRRHQRLLPEVLRGVHGSRPRRVAPLADGGHGEAPRLGVRRQPRRRHSHGEEREAPRRGGAVVQR